MPPANRRNLSKWMSALKFVTDACSPGPGYNEPQMADTIFKAFISCSFSPEDRAIVEFIKRLLSALNFNAIVYDRVEVENLTTSVEELIRTSDCMIALATRRSRIVDADAWTTSDWIHQEVAFARAHAKPIALFVERGVRMSGFVDTEVRRVTFSRESLTDTVDQVVSLLYSVRRALDEVLGARNRLKQITFTRDSVRIRESFTRTALSFTCDVLMETLEDVPVLYHSSVLEDDTPGLAIHPEEFAFRAIEHPGEVKVTAAIIQDTQRRHVWAIKCEPSLRRGQRLRYAFRLVGTNFRPFTYEEMQARLDAGTYAYREPICNVLDWTITYPTKELIYEMDFPPDYDVQDIRLRVMIGHSENQDEVKRVKSEDGLKIDKLFDSWSVRLRVINPLYGHNYGITYCPPRSS